MIVNSRVLDYDKEINLKRFGMNNLVKKTF